MNWILSTSPLWFWLIGIALVVGTVAACLAAMDKRKESAKSSSVSPVVAATSKKKTSVLSWFFGIAVLAFAVFVGFEIYSHRSHESVPIQAPARQVQDVGPWVRSTTVYDFSEPVLVNGRPFRCERIPKDVTLVLLVTTIDGKTIPVSSTPEQSKDDIGGCIQSIQFKSVGIPATVGVYLR